MQEHINQHKPGEWLRQKAWGLLLVLLMLATAGCRTQSSGADRLAEDSSAARDPETNLAFNNITLEEADEQGKTLWRVKAAQATYSPDQQTARVKAPTGQLYQNGQPIYRIQAQEGDILRGGDRIVLRGEVVATDTQSGAVLRADQMEWQPKQDTLLLRGNLRAAHPQMKLSANQAKLFNRQRRAEVIGKVNAITEDPKLRLQTEKVIWQIKDEKVIADRPVQIQRLQGDQATDQANADRAEVDLVKKTAHLKQNARLTILEPPLLISGNSLIWTVNQQTLVADQPITTLHRQQQITITANRGRMELKPQIAYFKGNVRANAPNQANLSSDDLTWEVTSQKVTAQGNVVYVQPDPPATLRGAKAVGRLQDRTVVVSGGRVVTEIVPGQDLIPGS
ncbi:MAG: LPS export ABC transporter periplasmic protein LptC [Elainella sp. Prado103]|jgi:LPS export ABC transporter protein LptC|nr:LPS export ABC transporter periplasmic protein LptC [Elainella sp. Prado103]